MGAAGLLDREDAVAYFKLFPPLLDQSVSRRVLIRPLTFERLLELMVDAKETDFVIVCHGHSDALLINLTKDSKTTVGVDELNILETVQTTQRELPSAGSDLSRWRRILGRLKIEMPPGWRELDSARVQELQSGVEQWLDGAATSLGLTRRSLSQLITLVERLQARGIGKVDFRGCDLGKKEKVLARFRRFFGARSMRAPQITSFFGKLDFGTHLNATAVRNLGRDGMVYGEAPKQVAIVVKYAGYSAALKGAAESKAAAVEWVAAHVGPFSDYKQRVPVHWLQTAPAAWPRDSEYRSNLTTVNAP
ncbi:MAG: hypothetical protein ACREH6_11570 [Geminicoccaceae bacterium]